ncbi:hypothetical protein pb186bvf_020729 [Paramecium bursaria]
MKLIFRNIPQNWVLDHQELVKCSNFQSNKFYLINSSQHMWITQQFVNPVFQPVETSMSASYHRSDYNYQPYMPTQQKQLPKEYEKIFSSETDLSSRMNDSLFNDLPRGSQQNDTLSLTQIVDQKRYNQEILRPDDSLINSSFLGAFNNTQDKIRNGFQQMDSLYNKLGDISNISQQPKLVQTIDDDYRAEMRDKVDDLPYRQQTPKLNIIHQSGGPQAYLTNRPIEKESDNRPSRLLSYNSQLPTYQPPRTITQQNETDQRNRILNEPKKIHTQSTTSSNAFGTTKVSSQQSFQSTSSKATDQYKSNADKINLKYSNMQIDLPKSSTTLPMFHSQLVTPTNQQVQQPQQPARNQIQQRSTMYTHTRKHVDLINLSKKVHSPQKSPERLNSPVETKQPPPPVVNQQQRTKITQQKILFDQAEQIVKIQRTQPQILHANWQKRQTDNMDKDKVNKRDKDLEVLCVICEEYVKFEDVDKHSQNCLAKSKINNQTQSATTIIQELNQKLEQLLKILQSQFKKQNEQFNDLQDCVSNIIRCNKNYKKVTYHTQELHQFFSQLQQNFDQKKFTILLLVQRALSLSQEKCLKLQFVEESSNQILEDESYLLSELSLIEKKAEQERNKTEQWRQRQQFMEWVEKEDINNMKYLRQDYLKTHRKDNELLSQINSETEYRQNDLKSQQVTNSVVSDMQYQKDFDSNNDRYERQERQERQERLSSQTQLPNEELKKKFYSLAVQIKLYLPYNHPGKNVLLQDLYNKAIQQKVPQYQWEQFISSEISQF